MARFTVKTDLTAANVNVRTGPSTAFGIIGTVARGAQFDISGRNQEYTWFQFCCVAGPDGLDFLQPGQCGERASDHAGAEHPANARPAYAYAGAAYGDSRASPGRPLRRHRRRRLQVLAAECSILQKMAVES